MCHRIQLVFYCECFVWSWKENCSASVECWTWLYTMRSFYALNSRWTGGILWRTPSNSYNLELCHPSSMGNLVDFPSKVHPRLSLELNIEYEFNILVILTLKECLNWKKSYHWMSVNIIDMYWHVFSLQLCWRCV